MGMIQSLFAIFFGGGQNVVKETAEVFRVNAEAASKRQRILQSDALAQFGAEFIHPRRGLFDRLMDGLNRVPRPAMALGTLALFASAMVDPIWFAARMQGLQLVPDALWWLLGAIVSFYFGARFQSKSQDFQRSVAQSLQISDAVISNINELSAMDQDASDQDQLNANAALKEWHDNAGK